MYAIIEAGGKQYKVEVGTSVKIEKIEGEVGAKVEFDSIFVSDKDSIKTLDEAKAVKVKTEIIAQGKEKKVIVYKYKAKKRTRSKNGHRQPYTEIKVLEIK